MTVGAQETVRVWVSVVYISIMFVGEGVSIPMGVCTGWPGATIGHPVLVSWTMNDPVSLLFAAGSEDMGTTVNGDVFQVSRGETGCPGLHRRSFRARCVAAFLSCWGGNHCRQGPRSRSGCPRG